MRFIVAVLLLTCSLTPAWADESVDAKVDALLAGYEYVPTASDWQRVGDGAAAVLMKRAADSKRDLVDRARAVSSLSHFPTKAVRAWLTTLQADSRAPEVLRRKATAALTHVPSLPADSPKPAVRP